MPMSPHRLALAGMLLAMVGALAVMTSARPASAAPAYDPIVLRALQDDGTFQGECWTWVRHVVADATGRQIGFDYRAGFFEAGAIEVSPRDARSGDVIQIADDRNTGPDADYPGLHTAIVMDNNGDGTFNVIDANSQWDGVVHRRPDYDPAAMSSRYPNLTFHIYRIGGAGGSTPGTAPASPKSMPAFAAGDRATVKAGGDCLNLRAGAGTSFAILTCLPDGTKLTVLDAPLGVGGRAWVHVRSGADDGWVAAEFLTRDSASAAGTGPARPLLPFRSVMILLASGG